MNSSERNSKCSRLCTESHELNPTNEVVDKTHRRSQRHALFTIRVQKNRAKKYDFDCLLEAAAAVADTLLRAHVTLPPDPLRPDSSLTFEQGERLPPVSCAMQVCGVVLTLKKVTPEAVRSSVEHPWDDELRRHVITYHKEDLVRCIEPFLWQACRTRVDGDLLWDVYKQALAVQERKGWPAVGVIH